MCRVPLLWVSCFCLLFGCSSRSHEAAPGIPPSRVTNMSRIVLPTAGGQTGQVPASMTDTRELWCPIGESEFSNRMQDFPPGFFDADFTRWFPSSEQEVMQRYIYSLTHKRRDVAERVLERAEDHLTIVLAGVRSRGLPLEIACLPMLESAFEPEAISHAGAAGLWQLMPETARRFGLIVNDEIDERFDVYKSTSAATAYLATLYKEFQNWPLALAAYNCGEGALRRALKNTGTTSLPELTQACRALGAPAAPLTEETLCFVPRFAAAVHIMTNSEKFGLTNRALLNRDSQTLSILENDRPLIPTGHYETHEMKLKPTRSRRIE